MAEFDFAKKYQQANFIERGLIDNFYKILGRLAAALPVKRILEVGCGPGFSTAYLTKIFSGRTIAASDYDKQLVETARRRNPLVDFQVESIYHLNRADASFDLVLCLEVLEHLTDPAQALAELARVTGRYCLISVPNEPLWRLLNMARGAYWGDWGNTPGHLNHWSSKQIASLVGREFKVLNVKKPCPWTIILAAKQ